jgi:hypothetical protein
MNKWINELRTKIDNNKEENSQDTKKMNIFLRAEVKKQVPLLLTLVQSYGFQIGITKRSSVQDRHQLPTNKILFSIISSFWY